MNAAVLLTALCLSMLLAAAAPAQQRPLNSHEVNADRSVTFRFKDPGATKVELDLEGFDAIPMAKDADGVWTVTTPPLDPEIYGYTFNADGESRTDPLNWRTKPNLIWQSSAVLVPGNAPMPWEMQNIPHGQVHHHFYHSQVIGDDRDFYVYTPPQYEESRRNRYPVLYLLHGYSDMAGAWTEVGKANLIMDTLIAQGKAKPMIVIMPLGYGVPDFAGRNSDAFANRNRTRSNYENFRDALLREVLPTVEREYRVAPGDKNRAIAGLSMGGAETLFVGLNNPDRFAYIGAFSSGGLGEDFAQTFPNATADNLNPKLKLLWIACGESDGLIKFNRNLVAYLKGKGVQLTAVETPGRHEWPVWRRNLISFSEQLFQ